MASLPKTGDKVRWNTPQGETSGTVQSIATHTKRVKGHTAKASTDHPEVVVKSDASGKTAVHKPESLKTA